MTLENTIAENLRAILDNCNLNPKNFSDLCVANGLGVNKSFISRLMSNNNYGIEKLNDVIAGINLLPGYDWVTASDLLIDNRFSGDSVKNKARIDKEQLQNCLMQMLVNMDEMEFLTLNTEIELKTMTSFCIVQLKSCGIEAVGRSAAAANKATLQA